MSGSFPGNAGFVAAKRTFQAEFATVGVPAQCISGGVSLRSHSSQSLRSSKCVYASFVYGFY